MNAYMKAIFHTALMAIVSGCASMPVYNAATASSIGQVINPQNIMHLIVGLGIIWYCWDQARDKNRNPILWLTLGFLFGFFALLVLVYLKKLSAPVIDAEHEVEVDTEQNTRKK